MIDSEASARAYCAELCDELAMDRLERFIAMLAEENGKQNLVSAASLEHVWTRHIADSLQLLTHVSRETSSLWFDLGTGAGFPGLAIALTRPDWPVILVESRKRRAEWLQRVCDHFELENCTVLGQRLEAV